MFENNTQIGYPQDHGALVRAKIAHARRIIEAQRVVDEARTALMLAELRLENVKTQGALHHE